MYVEQDSYTEYINAYKTYVFEVANVISRELGTNIPEPDLRQAVDDLFAFETELAKV